MTNRLMISVAAIALIAGTSFADAQGTMGREGGASGGAAAQSAPSSEHGGADRAGAGPAGQMGHDAGRSDMKSGQTEMQKSPGAANDQRADDHNMQGSKSKTMSSDNADKANADKNNGGKDMKAEGRDQNNNNMKDAQGTDRKMGHEAEGKSDRKSETVGQAGAGAKLSGEQRTRITTVIRDQHIAPVKNVNFSISVGTRVPRDVSFHPLPTEIVTVYPDWRGYEFILVNDQILVINPDSLEIVAVLDA
jgi:hypothetical protein